MIWANYNNPVRFDEILRRFHCSDCSHYNPEALICTLTGDSEFPGSGACEEFEPQKEIRI